MVIIILEGYIVFIQVYNTANIFFSISLVVSLMLLLHKIVYHIVGLFPGKKFPEANKEHKYGILIPARNESKVIRELLESIKNQSYNKNLVETFVIVESEDDPTCGIVKEFENTQVFIRQHLERKGKGHALNECLEYIFKEHDNGYEAFFILDADNVLDSKFIEEMNKTYDAGYQMALGYRNSKNWNDGWIASCSAVNFSMINTFQNKCRSRFNMNVIVSGTGFYIDANELRKLGGWPFTTLTEDYEISLYTTLNNLKSTYNEYAEFYDEQPTNLKVSWNQRLRWCKGFSQSNKIYKKELFESAIYDKENRISKFELSLNILPMGVLLCSLIGYMAFMLLLGIAGAIAGIPEFVKAFIALGSTLGSTYLFMAAYSLAILIAERKHTNIKFFNAVGCVIMSPFYLSLYVLIYISSLTQKEVEWKAIPHEKSLSVKKKGSEER